ncbi:MAG TPA: DEAD/DEAH box helicase [Cellvibrionaceae bacterium]
MSKPLTLRTIRNSDIENVVKTLYFSHLNPNQEITILKIAILFLNNSAQDIKDFGYRLLVKYSMNTDKYIPLYDVATLLGYTPISKLLKNSDLIENNGGFANSFIESFHETLKHDGNYQTESQNNLFDNFQKSMNISVAVVAPTSYGKSQLIEQSVSNNPEKNIAIIVPSKALISQTRARIKKSITHPTEQQLIIHHDMKIDNSRPIIAVVTQERMLRLFQKHAALSFDIVFIDEAHNLLSGDKRSRLLASSIILAKIRNEKAALKYLTPFLVSSESLQIVVKNHTVKEIKISEKLKTEDFFVCDINNDGKLKQYDQYLDRHFDVNGETYKDDLALLRIKRKRKNIIYLNKPKDIESYADILAREYKTSANSEIEAICNDISEYVHPKYRLLDCLKKGVAYHHGSVPDIVRGYIESSFKKINSIRWIVTNSTLLEGVNIPAETLFILDARKGRSNLTSSQFKNLAGRVNRFSEIFNPTDGSPQLLVPSIYLIASNYSRSGANIDQYIQRVTKVDKKVADEIENPLLELSGTSDDVIQDRDEELTYIENIEPGSLSRDDLKIAKFPIGRLCYIHNVFEFNINDSEESMNLSILEYRSIGAQISDAEELMKVISDIFLSKIIDDDYHSNLIRLKNTAAQSFYAMLFDWRMNQVNYKRMISKFTLYWKTIRDKDRDSVVFAGKWGNLTKGGHIENYVDLNGLSDYEMINLAIVRIKEEQDFIDNNLVKFLEILNDLELVDTHLYSMVKYGTVDPVQIALIKNGLTHIAATVLATKYNALIEIDDQDNVIISNRIIEILQSSNEKRIIIFEVINSGLITQ